MPDPTWTALKFAALIAALYALYRLSGWYSDRLEREADGPVREDVGAFPNERSGVVRRDGVQEERKVAGE